MSNFSHLVFDKDAKNKIHKLEKRKHLQQTVLGKLGVYLLKNEIKPISPCTTLKSKQIKELNMKPEILKLLVENISCTLHDIDIEKTSE